MTHESIALMLLDTCQELVGMAKAAKVEADRAGSEYDKGRHFALYEVLSLLGQQADAFGIDRASIGLRDFDPERDLLGKSV